MATQKTKKEIIFWIFVKRSIWFIVIILWILFWIYKVLYYLSWESYVMKFFWFQEKNYLLETTLKDANNLNQAKSAIFYHILWQIMYEKQKEKDDKSVTEFEFTISDLREMYKQKRDYYLNTSKYIWDNLSEFETLLSKIKLFQWYNLVSKDKIFKAKKIFHIVEWKNSYLLDISKQWNWSFWIKVYRAKMDWNDMSSHKAFAWNYSFRVQFSNNNKKKTLYLKNIQWTEIELFTYENWQYINKNIQAVNLKSNEDIEFFRNLLKFFVENSTYLADSKRNAFIIKLESTKAWDQVLDI